MYLSNNSLTTLRGLRQFTAVKVLSLANNKASLRPTLRLECFVHVFRHILSPRSAAGAVALCRSSSWTNWSTWRI